MLHHKKSAKIILAFGNYALGDNRSVLNILDEANLDPPANGENLEGHELGLKVMGNALEGMSQRSLTIAFVPFSIASARSDLGHGPVQPSLWKSCKTVRRR